MHESLLCTKSGHQHKKDKGCRSEITKSNIKSNKTEKQKNANGKDLRRYKVQWNKKILREIMLRKLFKPEHFI